MIRQNTFRQLRLVNNLLDITRVNAGRIKINKKNVDIVFLTKSIIESIYAYVALKSIDVTFVSLIEKKIIGIDDEKYERRLLNLLSNATKFTPEGKPIIVTLSSINDKICVEVKINFNIYKEMYNSIISFKLHINLIIRALTFKNPRP